MARLQWNPVQAPNFSGVNDTFRLASELGGRGAADIQRAFTRFQDADQNAADSIIRQRLAGIQSMNGWDPNAVLGSEGDRASQAVLDAVTARPQTLLAMDSMRGQESRAQAGELRAQAAEGRAAELHPLEVAFRRNRNIFDKNRDEREGARALREDEAHKWRGQLHNLDVADRNYTIGQRRAMQEASPLIQEAWFRRASGDIEGADAILADPRIRALGPEQFNSIVNTLSSGSTEAEQRFNMTAADDLYEFYERGGGMGTGLDEWIVGQMAEEGGWEPRRRVRMLQATSGQQPSRRGATAPGTSVPNASSGSSNVPLYPGATTDGGAAGSQRVMDTLNLATDQHIAQTGVANLVPKYEEAMQGAPSYAAAAKTFVDEFGGDPGVVANLLREMPGDIPIAARAAILENSLKSRTEGRIDFQDYFTGGALGSGADGLSAFRPNQRDIDAAVRDYRSDATQTQIVDNRELRRSQANLQTSSDRVRELDALIARTMSSERGNTSGTLDRLIQQRDQAAARLAEAEQRHSKLMGISSREDGGEVTPESIAEREKEPTPPRNRISGPDVPVEDIARMVPNVVPGGAIEGMIQRGKPVPRASVGYWAEWDRAAQERQKFYDAIGPWTTPGIISSARDASLDAIGDFAVNHIPAYRSKGAVSNRSRASSNVENQQARPEVASVPAPPQSNSSNELIDASDITSVIPNPVPGGAVENAIKNGRSLYRREIEHMDWWDRNKNKW